ncbi:MAG: hypothetical protein J5I90_04240 [Caldilineales bacterium]|nr:hypothetical protein [Caldilineales bacterium]
MTTKLTVRVPKDLLEGAKRYASEHETTVTRLISAYLLQLASRDELQSTTPIVHRLSGSLTSEIAEEDYFRYLEQKYGSEV